MSSSRVLSAAALLSLAVVPSLSAQAFLTWTGTGNNWNNMSRWSGWDSGGFPYGQLQWTGGGDTLSNNNFDPNANVWRLFFNGNPSYTITGNPVSFFDYGGEIGGIMSRSSGSITIDATVRFQDSGSRPAAVATRMGGSGTGGGGGSLTLNNLEIGGNVTVLRFSGETGAGAITVNGVISGSGKPVMIGRDFSDAAQSGTLVTFNGDNTYSGGTTLRAGTLRVGHNNALGTGTLTIDPEGSSARTLASGSSASYTLPNNVNLYNNLVLGQTSGGTGSLTIAGSVFLGNEAGQTRTLTVNGTHTISGAITGGRGLVKDGSGTLVLSGENTYAGSTTVSAGTLLIQGSNTGGGTITVGSGAVFGGDGSITGDLTFEAGSSLLFDPNQTLFVSGTVSFTGTFGIANLVGLSSATADGVYTIIESTVDFTNVINVGLANAVDLGEGKSAFFQSGSLQLVVIPEPPTLLPILSLALLPILRRRFRS